jgi:hypothetical protein
MQPKVADRLLEDDRHIEVSWKARTESRTTGFHN